MTTPIWCELVCRECAATTAGQFTYYDVPRAIMRKEAVQNGWHHRRANNEWYCKRCWERGVEPK
jgi:hypothetical protein